MQQTPTQILLIFLQPSNNTSQSFHSSCKPSLIIAWFSGGCRLAQSRRRDAASNRIIDFLVSHEVASSNSVTFPFAALFVKAVTVSLTDYPSILGRGAPLAFLTREGRKGSLLLGVIGAEGSRR